jgi:4-carboxymuconolactone decarboxylase
VPRLPPLPEEFDSAEVKSVFAAIRARGGEPSPLYRTLAHAPGMLAAWANLAWPLRYETSLEGSLRELIIMRIAEMNQARYQWAYHVRPALSSGLTQEQLDSLHDWRNSRLFDERQRWVLTYAEQVATLTVDDDTFAEVAKRFTNQELVELTLIAAFYTNVSRVLQALGIEVEESFERFLPDENKSDPGSA